MSFSSRSRASLRSARAALSFVAVTLVAACGGSSGGSSTAPIVTDTPVAAATIQATPSQQFTPNTVTLIAGGTLTIDFGSVAHNVFFDNAPAGAPANITAPSANTT